MFNKIKYYYETGLWNLDRIWNVVGKALTEKEYEEITGLKYPNKEWLNENLDRYIKNRIHDTCFIIS